MKAFLFIILVSACSSHKGMRGSEAPVAPTLPDIKVSAQLDPDLSLEHYSLVRIYFLNLSPTWLRVKGATIQAVNGSRDFQVITGNDLRAWRKSMLLDLDLKEEKARKAKQTTPSTTARKKLRGLQDQDHLAGELSLPARLQTERWVVLQGPQKITSLNLDIIPQTGESVRYDITLEGDPVPVPRLAQVSTNGNGVGNGGDAVVCPSGVGLLDFAEARLLNHTLIQESKIEDPYVIADQRLKLLEKLDPAFAGLYLTTLKGLPERTKFIPRADFRDVPDSLQLALPKDCQLQQLAIQQTGEGGRTFVNISKDLWDQMSPLHQAGLILHELIYEHFITLGEVNSVKARQFNALLFSPGMSSLTPEQYLDFKRSLGLRLY